VINTTPVDLAQSHTDGEDDAVLNDIAIEIFDRLKNEADEFVRVLNNIERGRHASALDRFVEYAKKELKDILPP
jgi:hypothetical protein